MAHRTGFAVSCPDADERTQNGEKKEAADRLWPAASSFL
jgi:hypothetical protein